MRNIPINQKAKKDTKISFTDPTADAKARVKEMEGYYNKIDITSFIESILKDLKADPEVSKYRLKKKSSEIMAKRSFIDGLSDEINDKNPENKAAVRGIISSLNDVKNLDGFITALTKHGVRVTIDADEEGKKAVVRYEFKKKKKNKFEDDDKEKKSKKKFKNEEEELDKTASSDEILDFYNLEEPIEKASGKCSDCGSKPCRCGKEGEEEIEQDAEIEKTPEDTKLPSSIEKEKKNDDDEEDEDEFVYEDDDEDSDEQKRFASKNKKISTILDYKIEHNFITSEPQYSSEYIKLNNMSDQQIEQEAAKYKISLNKTIARLDDEDNRLEGIIKEASSLQMLNRPIVISQKDNIGDKFGLNKLPWTDAITAADKNMNILDSIDKNSKRK